MSIASQGVQAIEVYGSPMKKLENTLNKRSERSEPDKGSGIVCASIREGAPTLLLLGVEGRNWVLPWVHFQYAWLVRSGEEETIKLFFSSHELSLEGVRLGSLLEHFAKFGVEWVRAYDRRYLELCPNEQPFVYRIKVEEKIE